MSEFSYTASRLSYDLLPEAGKGEIAEPSDEMLEEFFDTVKDLDFDDDEEGGEAPTFGEIQNVMIDAISKLCRQTPSAEELRALPLRKRVAFQKWLIKELTVPEDDGVAMNRAQRRHRKG